MATTTIQGIELTDDMPSEPGLFLITMNPTAGQLYLAVVTRVQGDLWGMRIGLDNCAYPLPKQRGQRTSMFRGTWWARRD